LAWFNKLSFETQLSVELKNFTCIGSKENDNVVIFSVYITTLQMERMGTVADLNRSGKYLTNL